MRRRDLIVAPLCEAALMLVVGVAGWLSHQPLIFASLGPTAYELVETPERRSATPYSILVGHAAAIAAGYFALYVTGALHAPPISTQNVLLPRVWAAVLAAAVTVFANLALKASQPAAVSTTLLIALGTLQQPHDAAIIMAAVALMTIVGEPLRKWRLRSKPQPFSQS